MLSDNVRAELAASLAQAERSRVAMTPMTDDYSDILKPFLSRRGWFKQRVEVKASTGG